MYKRILVPLDGSALSESALSHAVELARIVGAELILLRVAIAPVVEFAFSDPGIAERVVEEEENSAESYLEKLNARMQQTGLKTSTVFREGGIIPAILDAADEYKADLIAMATHGRRGMAHFFLGSIAEKIVRSSHIPVLLIRPQEKI